MRLVDNFPAALRQAREQAGLTQRQLANRVMVNHAQLSRYEAGEACPRPGVLRLLEACLGCSFRPIPEGHGPGQDDWVRTTSRTPPDLYRAIQDSAEMNERSINAEIVDRLYGSFRAHTALDKPTAERLIKALETYVARE